MLDEVESSGLVANQTGRANPGVPLRLQVYPFSASRAESRELYPNGGFLGTGFRMWGINGTARVLIEYTKKVRNKGLLLEPVDIKKDLYGFVYAREQKSRGLYNPFPNASAYHQ
jgi:hypothetical protein